MVVEMIIQLTVDYESYRDKYFHERKNFLGHSLQDAMTKAEYYLDDGNVFPTARHIINFVESCILQKCPSCGKKPLTFGYFSSSQWYIFCNSCQWKKFINRIEKTQKIEETKGRSKNEI